jgi:hypothetical protein
VTFTFTYIMLIRLYAVAPKKEDEVERTGPIRLRIRKRGGLAQAEMTHRVPPPPKKKYKKQLDWRQKN